MAGAQNRSCCFVHIKPESKVTDAASCRHETPVCCLLGLAPYSLVSNNQNWNRNVDPGAISLVWLIKRHILVLREPTFEFSTLAQETEFCSVQTQSIICNLQGIAPF